MSLIFIDGSPGVNLSLGTLRSKLRPAFGGMLSRNLINQIRDVSQS